MNLYKIVFSATGRTRKVVDIISSVFGKERNRIDLSELNSENKISFLKLSHPYLIIALANAGWRNSPVSLSLCR